jgi:hypothetical protein
MNDFLEKRPEINKIVQVYDRFYNYYFGAIYCEGDYLEVIECEDQRVSGAITDFSYLEWRYL